MDTLKKLENHIRPQMYFLEYVQYHVIADGLQLSNVTIMAKILHGFPCAIITLNVMRANEAAPKHVSCKARLDVLEKAAVALHLFADLSKQGPHARAAYLRPGSLCLFLFVLWCLRNGVF